jgi:CBS domain-containing protein
MNAELSVREIMDREYVGVSESDGLVETVELLLEEQKETAVVLHGSEHVGVLTERDVLSLLVGDSDPEEATVADAMTEHVPTVSPEETVESAADRLSTESARRLVVANGAEPLGVVTEEDLLAGRRYPTERSEGPGEGATAVTGEAAATEAGTEALEQRSAETIEQADDGFENQGICEVCGSLSRDLSPFNGQLLCPECRDV